MVGLGLHRNAARDAVSVPFGIGVNIGAVAVIAASFLDATLPASQAGLRLGALVVVVGGFAVWAADLAMAGSVCVIAFALLNGFLVNTSGELSWHGRADDLRLGALFLASGVGVGIGLARRSLAAHQRFSDLEALANGEPLYTIDPRAGFASWRVTATGLLRQAQHRRDPRR